MHNLITDVPGLAIGNAHDHKVGTGVSVVLPTQRAIAAVDVRGGGPGTRETDALCSENLVDAVDAIVLSGGSSYGLEAASATANWLGARGRGFQVEEAPLVSPVVPAAILFDLANGGDKNWGEQPPYAHLGRAACEQATDGVFSLGTIGAGYGAKSGLYKGGLGSASCVSINDFVVGALVAVNSFGSALIPDTDCFWAWPFEQEGEFGGKRPKGDTKLPSDWAAASKATGRQPGSNTTLAVIATNAPLSPASARRVAIMAQDGLARALRPVHTPLDGDTVFTLSTAAPDTTPLDTPLDALAIAQIGAQAADCLARAVARGVFEAQSLFGSTAYQDRH